MQEYIIDLTVLVNPPKTDSISGREFGEQHAKDTQILSHLEGGDKIIILIDSTFVKAINDSFIKGFFSKLFEKYRSSDRIKESVVVRASEDFQQLFEKNWTILEAIYNA
jgi:hypothetical protein